MNRSMIGPWMPMPGHNSPILQKAVALIGKPVGISLTNGQGVSGVLCSVLSGQIYLLQYLYHSQFATFHYAVNTVNDIYPFPVCQPQQGVLV